MFEGREMFPANFFFLVFLPSFYLVFGVLHQGYMVHEGTLAQCSRCSSALLVVGVIDVDKIMAVINVLRPDWYL